MFLAGNASRRLRARSVCDPLQIDDSDMMARLAFLHSFIQDGELVIAMYDQLGIYYFVSPLEPQLEVLILYLRLVISLVEGEMSKTNIIAVFYYVCVDKSMGS